MIGAVVPVKALAASKTRLLAGERRRIEALRSEGIFTPPSFEGSVVFPGTAGGSNWGSVAFDPERGLLFANTSRIANTIQIVNNADDVVTIYLVSIVLSAGLINLQR